MTTADQRARAAERSSWLDHAVRFGLVAYGVVHLLIGWLALQLALHRAEGEASGSGALHELAGQPFGTVMLLAIALGMALLVVWRVLEAAYGHDGDGASLRWAQAVSLGKAALYGTLGWTAVKTALGEDSGGGEDALTARVMALPFGVWLVGLIGLGIAGYGVSLVVRGLSGGFAKSLNAEGRSGDVGRVYLLLGRAGHLAKGTAIIVVGGLFGYAAWTRDADESGGLDVALRRILQQPFGPWLLGAVAVGLAAYGLFCFARARHLSR